MFSASSDRRSRIIAFVLSLAVIVLIFLMLIDMGLIDLDRGPSGAGTRLVAVRFASSSEAERKTMHAVVRTAHRAVQAVTQPHPEQPQPVPSSSPAVSFLHLSHDEFASSDISKMARPEADSDSSSQSSASTYGPGEGPGGAHLFNAAWYREPSDAEIAPYIEHGAPAGAWATIACRTVEHFHVEDCEELDESPPGSGLSRALRRAAWQFLVRPPRINGHALIGAWVKIRFDFIARKSSEGDAGQSHS